MKLTYLLTGILAAFFIAATPVTAQTLYLHGGADFPSSSGLNDAYKTGYGAVVGVGLPITSEIEGLIRGSFDRFENDLGGIDNFSSYSATANLKLNGPMMSNRVTPYALGGGGLFRLGVEDAYETEFGLSFGAGLGIRTSGRTSLLLEPNYVLVFNEGENLQYFPVRLGVSLGL